MKVMIQFLKSIWIWNYWRIYETLFLLDYSNNVPFNYKYKQFINEYEEESLNVHKRNIAINARKKLMEKFDKKNKAPISDTYLYEHIEMMMI